MTEWEYAKRTGFSTSFSDRYDSDTGTGCALRVGFWRTATAMPGWRESPGEVAMIRVGSLGAACLALLVLCLTAAVSVRAVALQTGNSFADAAAKANPELISSLSKELGSTPAQSAGAAGALFGLAQARMKPDEFSQVSKAVPGMDSLLKAAPSLGSASALSGAAGLASLAGAFSKLGLKPELVAKAIPVLTSFVSKSGGAGVGSLLANVLK